MKPPVSNTRAVASALNAISMPYSTSVSVPLYAITARSIATPYSTSVSVPLYAITARGQLPRHIVRQFQSPYTPSPRGLSRISARQVALALASRFSRMLSFQIKDMEFTVHVTSAILDCRYACLRHNKGRAKFLFIHTRYTLIIMSSEIYIDYYVK